ncbi:ATP-binding protein [Streptomyces sp. NPDC003395]
MEARSNGIRAGWGPLEVAFLAEPKELAALRRLMRSHLEATELSDLVGASQLCASELVSNVIRHVGPGTPTTLVVCRAGRHLRIEVHDPDARALPTLMEAGIDSEGGRGLALVAATADRWGVELRPDRKVTWCELAAERPHPQGEPSRLTSARAEGSAINIITDLLHWLQAHGRDPDDVLDRAVMHFEAEVGPQRC